MKAYRYIDELQEQFEERKGAIRRRLAEFAQVHPNDYFYELVYCLLTPQSTAVNAGKTVEVLRRENFLQRDLDAAEILSRKMHYIRFHNTKARRLFEAKEKSSEILDTVCSGRPSPELREWLVTNVKGLGWKEASHFLRNIGHRELAILDRHILKNLAKHRVLRSLPKTLTQKRYLGIEEQFKQFSSAAGISIDELDLLFWSNETGEILK